MNIANRLTMLRIFLIPVFLVVLYFVPGNTGLYWAAVIFVVASMTDFLDGYLARSRHLVTDFGKLMDPLADKLLVTAALVYFVSIHRFPAWAVILILGREFLISGFRQLAASKGIVMAAGIWGKVKTALTMVMVPIVLLEFLASWLVAVGNGLFVAVVFFTLLSAVDYLFKNKSVITDM